jgi:hypothetical protein
MFFLLANCPFSTQSYRTWGVLQVTKANNVINSLKSLNLTMKVWRTYRNVTSYFLLFSKRGVSSVVFSKKHQVLAYKWKFLQPYFEMRHTFYNSYRIPDPQCLQNLDSVFVCAIYKWYLEKIKQYFVFCVFQYFIIFIASISNNNQ